jgi:alanyl-tRNA synthetase
MSTLRLDQNDPLLFTFDAHIVAHATWKGAPSVVLDESAFYPESGGQMADRGTLAGLDVRDVQIDDAGRVHHVLDGALPEIGAWVHGAIDASRRRTHMALHSAQHLVSRALCDISGTETTSSRLGESVCTIDVDRDGISEARISEAESLVNEIVEEDRAVRAWFPERDELASLPLRRAPKSEYARVRVVDIGGFDVSPCGGTHVLRTSQVGLFRIISTERYKGGTRISFSAGPRARRELLAESNVLRESARLFGTVPLDVSTSITRLFSSLTETREELGRMRSAFARALASNTRDSIARIVLSEGGVELARQLATELTRQGDRVAIIAATIDGGIHVVVARGPHSSVDARGIFETIAKRTGGRGGGRPERAEGRLPQGADIEGAMNDALT